MRTARQRTILGRRPAWSSARWFAPGLALLLVLGSGGDGFAASHSPATNAPSLAPINLNIGFNGVKEPQSADTAIQLLFALTLCAALFERWAKYPRNLFWRANSREPAGVPTALRRPRLALAELLLNQLGSAMRYETDDDSGRIAGIFDWPRLRPGPAKRVAGSDLAGERRRAGRRNLVALVGEALDQKLGASAPPPAGPPESVHTDGMISA